MQKRDQKFLGDEHRKQEDTTLLLKHTDKKKRTNQEKGPHIAT